MSKPAVCDPLSVWVQSHQRDSGPARTAGKVVDVTGALCRWMCQENRKAA
jgi:hypothetical protein